MHAENAELKPFNAGAVARRPAVLAVVLLMAGIVTHELFPPLSLRSIYVLLALAIAAVASFRVPRLSSILLGAGLVLAGVNLAQLEHYHVAADDIAVFVTDTPRLARLEVELNEPTRILSGLGQYPALPPRQVTCAQVKRVMSTRGWIDASGGILVQVGQPHPRLAQGQRVRLMGYLQRPSPAMNPGQFDWAQYYRRQGVLASITVPWAENLTILEEHSAGPLAYARTKARHLLAMGFSLEASVDHALLQALLLGDHDPEIRDIQELFRRTGTSHHISISGMHVAVLGAFVFGICRLLCLAPRTSARTMIVFVLCYGALTMPSAPVIRAVLLSVGFGIGLLNRRTVDSLQLLALCALVMLCWRPNDLFNAGFQLSFGTVLGLIVLTGPVFGWFDNPEDRIIAEQHNWRGRRWRLWLGTRPILLTATIAWLISLPLIAFHFEQLNPWAIPAGILLAIPVMGGLIAGICKVMLSTLYPGFSVWWAAGASVPIIAMRRVLGWLALLPGSDVPLPAPSITIVVVFYILVIVPFLRWPVLARRRHLRWLAPLAGCALILLYPLRARWAIAPAGFAETRITLLSVGAGQCCIIAPAGAPVSVVDAGSVALGNDLVRKTISPFLRHEGRREIGRLLLTHGDFDHASSALETAESFGVPEILTSPHFRRLAGDLPSAETLIDALDRQGNSPRQIARGDRIDLGGGAQLAVLWPRTDTEADSNNTCLVLKITAAGRSVLLPADIQDPAMTQLLKDPAELKCDVLVAPHHGSAESQTAAFLSATEAKYILASDDRTPTQRQVRFDTLAAGRVLYRTHWAGAITVVIRSDGKLWIETHLPRR